MKLIRFGAAGAEKPGVELPDGKRIDVSKHVPDYGPDFFAAGGLDRLAAVVKAGKDCPEVPGSTRLGSPVARPNKFVAIGLNYRKHAAEVGAQIPTEPEVFTKHTSCICGPNDDVEKPKGSTKLDYEVELAFVIGKRLKYLANEADALDYVAGYMICNDVSERDFQMRTSQWTKGKSHDTFGPLGPVLVTADELGDPHNLKLSLKVNGEVRQDSNTNDFIFNCNKMIHYLSQFMTLEPGDVITTGTPSGVAMGMKPQGWVNVGDTMEVTIEKLGTQTQKVVAAS